MVSNSDKYGLAKKVRLGFSVTSYGESQTNIFGQPNTKVNGCNGVEVKSTIRIIKINRQHFISVLFYRIPDILEILFRLL